MKKFFYRLFVYWWAVPILVIIILLITWFKDLSFDWKEMGQFFIDMWSLEK